MAGAYYNENDPYAADWLESLHERCVSALLGEAPAPLSR